MKKQNTFPVERDPHKELWLSVVASRELWIMRETEYIRAPASRSLGSNWRWYTQLKLPSK